MSGPWSLKLPNNEWSSWSLKIFDDGVQVRVEFNARLGRRVSESEVEALCLKNSADRLRNNSGRDARFRGDNMIFVSENWWDKIDRIPKDRSRINGHDPMRS